MTCVDASKVVATCSTSEQTTGCALFTDNVFELKTVSQAVVGDLSADQAKCNTEAAKQTGYVAGGTNICALNIKTVASCSAAETAADRMSARTRAR